VALGASTPLSDLVSHACRARRARTASDVPWGEKRLQVWVVPLDGPTADCLLVLREAAAVGARRDLWQAEKMAALGRLAASVAHEVRNPLGAVDIQLQLLAKDAEEIGGPVSTRLTQRVDRARAEMRRLDGIVQNFLRFSRPPAVHLTPTDPGLLVQRMHDLVAPEARARGIELELRRPDELPFVKADENVLSQALLNVLINAFQAVGEGQDEPLVELNVAVEAVAPSVRIEVTDNGCGVAEDDLERVFEYYYTTKDTGSGLGLSIAQGILQQHGGNLHLTSRVGSGTTVALVLPTCSLRP
jgi:signal transduction histidine kinase